MDSVGVRELKEHTSAILRRVRDEGESVDVTYRGKVIARLVPATGEGGGKQKWDDWWAEFDALSDRISEGWPEGVSAVDAVREQRREL